MTEKKHLTSYVYKAESKEEYLAFVINVFSIPGNLRYIEVWEVYTDENDNDKDFVDAKLIIEGEKKPKDALKAVNNLRKIFREEGLKGGIAENLPTFRHATSSIEPKITPLNPKDN